MSRSIRFHCDENVSDAVANSLRQHGINVTTVHGVSLKGASDPEQIAYARSCNRVLFTQDADFLVMASQGIHHSGIVYCRQQSRTIGEIIDGLVLIWELCEPDEMPNHIELL